MAASDSSYEDISLEITARRAEIADTIVAAYDASEPDPQSRWSRAERREYQQEVNILISYLAQAIAIASPELFIDYIAWSRVTLSERTIPISDLERDLNRLSDALHTLLPDEMHPTIAQYIEAGLAQCTVATPAQPSFLPTTPPYAELSRNYLDALLAADRRRASTLVLDAVKAGMGVTGLYVHVFQPTQQEIGRLWQLNQVSVAQEHYCTAATQLIMSQLYEYIFANQKNGRTIVAACVAEDLHELGVRMVADFFEMEGWKTIYLGANTPISSIVQTLIDQQADILALSATMAYHIQGVIDVIKAVRASNAREVKVLVGGHPFNRTPGLWKKIGADGYAADASAALVIANELLHA